MVCYPLENFVWSDKEFQGVQVLSYIRENREHRTLPFSPHTRGRWMSGYSAQPNHKIGWRQVKRLTAKGKSKKWG